MGVYRTFSLGLYKIPPCLRLNLRPLPHGFYRGHPLSGGFRRTWVSSNIPYTVYTTSTVQSTVQFRCYSRPVSVRYVSPKQPCICRYSSIHDGAYVNARSYSINHSVRTEYWKDTIKFDISATVNDVVASALRTLTLQVSELSGRVDNNEWCIGSMQEAQDETSEREEQFEVGLEERLQYCRM